MASLKLLVIEDDIANLELMSEVFASLEAEVIPIRDSREAAGLIDRDKFDGIFLDLEMPHMHGFELARRIRSSSWNKATPIVVITGRDEKQTMQDAFAAGASFFLQKPIDRQKLGILFRTVRGGMLENRRRSVRVPLQTDVTCEVGSRTSRGVTWNLSQGGIQIEADGLQQGDTVQLSFRLPVSQIDISAIGTVLWAHETRQGIRFTKVSERNLQSIRNYISEVEK
jgi:CheY-like chemotaxis protein